MSKNRRKNLPTDPVVTPPDPTAARVIAIPKTPEGVETSPPSDPVTFDISRTEVKTEARTKTKGNSERIGDILRAARLERNDDLYLIAEYLCIKPAFLIALEYSRYDEFPADAYVIGFLRTYANFLGVDGKTAVDRYRYEMAGRRKKPVLLMPTPMSEGRAPSGIIMVGVTVALLLIYALWYGISSANRTEANVPPPLPTTSQPVSSPSDTSAAAGLTVPLAPAAVSPPVVTPAPSPLMSPVTSATTALPAPAPGIVVSASQSTPANTNSVAEGNTGDDNSKKQVYGDPNKTSRLIIRATQNTWVMVTDASGKAIFDHVLKPGDVYKVPNKSGLSLTTGNGAGIVLSLDGTDLPKLASGTPHVVRNISLDTDHLVGSVSDQ